MKKLLGQDIRGVWAAVLLPLDANYQVDFSLLREQLDRLIASGVAGVYTNGTAGEFHNQTEQEFDQLSSLVAECCEQAGLPFQLGVCHPCPITTYDRLKRVLALKPSAIQVILPDWFPTSFDEDIEFFRELQQMGENNCSWVLYNPPHAKKNLSLGQIAKLKQTFSDIQGVKLCDGGASWYAEMRACLKTLSVFVPGHHMATGVIAGAHGSYSNVAALNPACAQRWYDLIKTDPLGALRIERSILDFFQAEIVPLLRAGFANPALDKFMCEVGDWTPISCRMRGPYRSIPRAEVARVRPIYRQSLAEFLALV